MKKYITIAALLAAGSAFANAATSEPVTFTSASGTDEKGSYWDITNSTNAITVAVLLDASVLKGYFQSQVDQTNTTLAHSILLVDGNNDIGVGTLVKNNVGEYFSGQWNSTIDYTPTGVDIDMGREDLWTNADKAALVISADRTTGTRVVFQMSYTDKTDFVTVGTAGSVKSGSWANLDKIYFDSEAVVNSSAAVYDYYLTLDEAKAVASSMIPEPSAFGLLAGLGALALVGTRRRRR